MDKDFVPLRNKPHKQNFKKGDVLVLFGELFNRGYANGLVEEAEACGMTVIKATVGRRDENQNLRALNETEIPAGNFINIPLEAGFDLEKNSSGQNPCEQLKSVKLSDWQNTPLNEKQLLESLKTGRKRFTHSTQLFLKELSEKYLSSLAPGQHVHFAHLMAGGVPRAKVVLPLMNRVFKGTGERYLSSKEFWMSSIGRFLEMNFNEVTAQTFNILIQESEFIRKSCAERQVSVSYVAYGYHGTEVMIHNDYKWQSYAPYIQGWAKRQLEDFSKKWSNAGVACCVYNCPEILTNSSSIFKGVEIAVYNLIRALEKEAPQHPLTQKALSDCQNVLKDPSLIKEIFKEIDAYMDYSESVGTSRYENWPQHSVQEHLERTLALSDTVYSYHKDENQLMTGFLSEIIFKSCGYIMLHDGKKPQNPVAWIGHDVVAKCI